MLKQNENLITKQYFLKITIIFIIKVFYRTKFNI